MPDNTGELTPSDLADFTKGRLDKNAPATKDCLAAALAAARRFCRWHVTPALPKTITMDGPNSRLLVLPTLRIQTLTSVTEDGVLLDLSTLQWSTRGKVRKASGALWTKKYSGLVVVMTHGFPTAPDFQRAVLMAADRHSLSTTGGRPTVVGPFQYPEDPVSGRSGFSVAEEGLLREYRREAAP